MPGGGLPRPALAFRLGATAALVAGYYWVRSPLDAWVSQLVLPGGRQPPRTRPPSGWSGCRSSWPCSSSSGGRWPYIDKKLQAPLLITVILALGDATAGVLESLPAPELLVNWTGGRMLSCSPTFLTIAITMLTELAIGDLLREVAEPHGAGRADHAASLRIKFNELWPFVLCGTISITSKYVLRLYGRHLWNPTNFGVTMMLFLAPQHIASLTVQAGNNGWAVAIIWFLGGMVVARLGRWHIPLTFIAAFIPLSILRSWVTGHPWQTEIAPITSPMFQLYIFFMITDPPTTTRARWSQVLVAVLVAVMETVCRLAFKDVHSLYHALFTVGPAANLIEIIAGRIRARRAAAEAAGGMGSAAV